MATQTWYLAIAFGLALYLAFVVVQRLRSGNDPSIRYQVSNAGGTSSTLLSGTHVTMLLASGIGLMLFLAGVWRPLYAFVLVGVVTIHYAIEKNEVEMS